MKTLIADDDDITRLLLSTALHKLGHEVREASNGREALEAWQSDDFPLIISDWIMPDLDGLEFCRRIRAKAQDEFTYIILLTSRSGSAHYLEAMAAGADDFITKPFVKQEFAARVQVAQRILRLHENLRTVNAELESRVRERTAELETALKAKTEMLSRASHELRTPMNHIMGFAQLLEMDALSAEQASSVHEILTSSNDLMRLIDRILAVSSSTPDDFSFLDAQALARPSFHFHPQHQP